MPRRTARYTKGDGAVAAAERLREHREFVKEHQERKVTFSLTSTIDDALVELINSVLGPEEPTLNDLADQMVETRKNNGFHTPESLERAMDREAVLGKLMLVLTEVNEYNHAEDNDNAEEELADVAIRTVDILRTMGEDITRVSEWRQDGDYDADYTHDAVKWVSQAAEFVRKNEPTWFKNNLFALLARTEREADDLWAAVKKKMEKNKNREKRHGTTISL